MPIERFLGGGYKMKTRQHVVHIAILTLALFTMASCVSPVSTTPEVPTETAVPTKAISTMVPAFITPIATLVLPSPEITPTISTIFNNPNRVTDGKLKLFIEEPSRKCHSPGDMIPVKISYQNLTDEQLTIVDFNIVWIHALVAYAQVVPVLTNLKNERIPYRDDYMSVLVANLTSPLLQQIPPNSSFELLAEYRLPSEMVVYDGNQQLHTSALPAGQYLLKFVYIAGEYEGTWEGEISSNQIEICVSD